GSSITQSQDRDAQVDNFVRIEQDTYNSAKLKKLEDWLFDEQTSYESKSKLINYLYTWKYTGALAMIRKFIHQTLAAADMTPQEEMLLNQAIKSLSHMKENGVLSSRNVGKHTSIIGTIYEVIDKYDITRTNIYVKMHDNFSKFDILFDFPKEEPFYEGDAFAKDLANALESFGGNDIKINYEITQQPNFNDDFTQGKMSLKFIPDIETLTSFWKSLAPHDFKVTGDADGLRSQKRNNNFFRAFTADEIYDKFLERSKNFYHEAKPIPYESYHVNNSLQLFLFGYGNYPGAFAIIKNPEKFKDVAAFPAEPTNGIYIQNIAKLSANDIYHYKENREYGVVDMLRASNTYEDLKDLGQYNPYFAHYMPDEGVQHYVFLARGAGAVFTSAYMKGLLRGFSNSDSMFFISRDSFGEGNWDDIRRNIKRYIYNDVTKKKGVANFKVLTFQVLKDLKEHYFEEFEINFNSQKFKIVHSHGNKYYLLGLNGEKLLKFTSNRESILEREKFENAPEIDDDILLKAILSAKRNEFRDSLDEVYAHFLRTGIINRLSWDGINPAKICVVDEVAVGTFDFVFKFVVEELSRQDPYEIDNLREKVNEKLGGDYWYLFDKDPFEFSAQDGELAEKLYEAIKAVKAENSKEAIDSDIFIGHVHRLKDEQIIDGYPTLRKDDIMKDFGMTEEEADKVEFTISLKADFAPHIVKIVRQRHSKPQIEFEADWVLLEAYLKALLSYNGVIDYYNREYKRLAVETLKEMIESDKTSISTKYHALAALQEFPYDSVIEYLESLISSNDSDDAVKERASSVLKETFDSYMKEMIDGKMSEEDGSFIKNFSLVMENEQFLKKLSVESGSNYIKLEIFRTFKAIDLKRERMRLIGIDANSFAALKQHHVMALREMDFYLVPLRSDFEDEERMDDFNAFKIKRSNWHFIKSMPEDLSSEKIFDTIVQTTKQEINEAKFVHAQDMPINPKSNFYSKQPFYRGKALFSTNDIDSSEYLKYEGIFGLDTVFYVDPELKIDRRMLATAVAQLINTHDLRKTRPQKIVISKLDKSEHLFEDHLSNGFIGINASVNGKSSEQRIILQAGLFHELSHEFTGKSGEEFEAKQTQHDVNCIEALIKKTAQDTGESRFLINEKIVKIFVYIINTQRDNI
ncbi:MAG: hypothetical protein LBU09_01965, partial [Endomicrobium sp.]|nr:hypothetical protein [Endomicrobium sp.]